MVKSIKTIPTNAGNIAEATRGFARRNTGITASNQLTFSKHLTYRLKRRKLELPSERVERLQQAVEKVASKGSRDSVIFLDELALLVNIPSRTVLTAVKTDNMKEGIFTNIDSVAVG